MVLENLEKKLKTIGFAFGFGAAAFISNPMPAYADTIYHGKLKNAEKAAYVEWNAVKEASKYTKELNKMDNNDPKYNTIKEKRNKSVKDAIKRVGKENNYDVVVEKDDPKIDNYNNINNQVKKKIKDIEE